MKRTPPVQKHCPYCGGYYTPYIRAAETQKSCRKAVCRKKRQREAYKSWRVRNPNYFRGLYGSTKRWLDAKPGYLRRYRADHPEYIAKDNIGRQRRRRKIKRFRADIQNGLLRRKIAKIRAINCADIQNGLTLKVDGLLSLMSG